MRNTIIILAIACFSLMLHADDSDDILQSKVTFQKGVVLEGWEKRFQQKKEEPPRPESKEVEQKQEKIAPKKQIVTHIKRAQKPMSQTVKIVDEKPLEIVEPPPEVPEKPESEILTPLPKKEEKPEKKEPPVEKKQPIKEEKKQQKDNDEKKTRKERLKELKKRQRGDSFKNRKVD